jgi:subtilisin family serine protease
MNTPIRFRMLPVLFSLIMLLPTQPSFAELGQKDHATEGAGPRKEAPRFKGDELLIRFAPVLSKGAKDDSFKRRGFKKIKEFPSLNLYQVKIRPNQTVEAARDEIRNEPGVLYAEPNFLVTTQVEPNDPRFPELWAFKNTGQTGGTDSADIDAPGAWDITTGSSDVVIAVIDTGIDYRHGDLAGNMWVNMSEANGVPGVDDDGNGYVDDIYGIDTINNDGDPLDDHDHGTHIAGTIGAVGNNGIGIAGLNWVVRMMACKFIGADGSGSVADAIECLQYVQQMRSRGVNVLATNNSYGMSDYSQALADAIDAQRDILFITAAGNSSQNVDRSPAYPAGYFLPNILAVEATDSFDQLAYFSNYGVQTVLVGAPGVDILSTLRNDNYGLMSGTSMATPHVTGLAALIKSYHTSANWAGIRNRILSGGEDVSSLTGTSVTGRRVTASGSLNCNNHPLLAAYKYSFTVGAANTLSAISINCESPQGPVTATPSIGASVTLNDDGLPPDLAAGDGIFTASWTPMSEVSELTFS